MDSLFERWKASYIEDGNPYAQRSSFFFFFFFFFIYIQRSC